MAATRGSSGESNAVLYTMIMFIVLFLASTVVAVMQFMKNEQLRQDKESAETRFSDLATPNEYNQVKSLAVKRGGRVSSTALGQITADMRYLNQLIGGEDMVNVEIAFARKEIDSRIKTILETAESTLFGPEGRGGVLSPDGEQPVVSLAKVIGELNDTLVSSKAEMDHFMVDRDNREINDARTIEQQKQQIAEMSGDLTVAAGKSQSLTEQYDKLQEDQAGKYQKVIDDLNSRIELQGVYFDTMLASYLLDSTRSHHNLDSLARDHLGHETIHLDSLIGKGKKQICFDQVELELASQYAAEDAVVTWNLTQHFDPKLKDPQLRKLFDDVEMPLAEVLAQMEFNGIAVNVKVLNHLATMMTNQCEQLVESIHKEAGCQFNVDSPRQLAEVLFETLQLTPLKKGKTGPSTDQEVLETLRWQHPIPAMMLEYRQLSKLNNTYVAKLPSMICPRTGRIHASFNQAVAATGRLSSSNPNLQNIPIRSKLGREIRSAFVAQKEGHVFVAADYSQIELRLLAHFSQDPNLLQAFESGQDIHRFVAAQVYDINPDEVDSDQRGKAKAVNFGIIYGQTPFGLSRSIGIPVDQAKQFIDEYFNRYPKIQEFMDTVMTEARKDGYVKTILGRRRLIPELYATNKTRQSLAQRLAVNTIIQGSAADLIKIAMVNIHRKIKNENLDMKMILQVHDELVFELPQNKADKYAKIIQKEMTHAIPLKTPIAVDIGTGKNWLECK